MAQANQPLLVSLRYGNTNRTFSIDGAAQSMVWIGFDEVVTAENAIGVVVSEEGRIVLRPTRTHALLPTENSDAHEAELSLTDDAVHFIEGKNLEGNVRVHSRPVTEGIRSFQKLVFTTDTNFTIGRTSSNGIVYPNRFVSGNHVEIAYRGGTFYAKDNQSGNGTLLNGSFLTPHSSVELKVGDVLQVLDLVLAIGRGFISHNCPEGLEVRAIPGVMALTHEAIKERFPEAEEDVSDPPLFYPAPRLSRTVSDYQLQVDDPPAKKAEDETPVLMQLGPSVLMGFSSVFMAANSISTVTADGNWLRALPSIAMAVSMLGGSLVWPIISRNYNRRQDARMEERRSRRYVDYLDGIENQLSAEAGLQGDILRENRLPITEIVNRASTLSPFMMNRMSSHADFMELRVGMGDVPLSADVKWPQQRFTLVEDPLLNKAKSLSENPPRLANVPIAFNPVEHYIAGVVGERSEAWSFLRGILVQICSYYSYQDVKIIMVGDEREAAEWAFLNSLQHFYNEDGTHRYVALSAEGVMEENALLMAELEARSGSRVDSVGDLGTYYVVVCTDNALADRLEAIHGIASVHANLGISLIYLSESLHGLPRECTYIIDLARESERYFSSQRQAGAGSSTGNRRACMFEQADVTGTMVSFDPDIMLTAAQAKQFALDISRARLDVASARSQMPDSVGFLEMFKVGNVAHLNIAQRWQENDASRTLQTPTGIDEMGEHATLNLHENIHGPHGLIAGTTGSGKSEFIITYILSLCVNYSPDEVAFVLIDYKGGGLAGAFENERYHLPHLAGTITNLDGGAIQRSLVSIQSELKRRQDMFNKARDITGESTIDIYKYISYYRQGVLKEALPHLFIVADEFAELKQQEPEFMDELISAARIGRSLGVHLILATQRPTGVVNDQIWANSKFKVCLKVADAGDSKEMIHRPDAAEIKQPGRYYLLVGYNESFSGGQAAYAGAKYVEREKFEPKTDNAVDMLDNEGAVITTLRPAAAARKSDLSELNAVLAQLIATADALDKHAQRLWLDPLPERITFNRLEQKYGPVPTQGLTFTLGEVDDPMRQRQFRHTIDLVDSGNVLFFGMHTSGVGSLVAATIYDMASRYTADELWFYGIDLGAGSIAALRGLPQCGGVCVTGEDEKIENLFKLLEREIENRKQVVAAYKSIDGYNAFARKSGKPTLPRIVFAIDNLASFKERYERIYERVIGITMDGPLCGVYSMFTAANNNTPGMKVKQNFPVSIVCAMSDPTEGTYILVNARNAPTPTTFQRGLLNIDKEAFEFQGGSIGETEEQEEGIIATLAARMEAATDRRAKGIPVLPAHVTAQDMGEVPKHQVPVGYSKQGVEPFYYNTSKFAYMLVVGEDTDILSSYFQGMRETFRAQGVEYRFIDDSGLVLAPDDEWVLTSVEQVEAFVLSLPPNPLQAEYYVFTNMPKTMSSLSEQGKAWLTDLLVNERTKHKVVMVAGIEAMKTKGRTDEWFVYFKNAGGGVWIGNGFGNQMVFSYGRTLPAYNKPAGPTDGFVVQKGVVTSVRLVEREVLEGDGQTT